MKPKNAVTISIIATVPSAPSRTETTCRAAQSKGFRTVTRIRSRLVIWSNTGFRKEKWGAAISAARSSAAQLPARALPSSRHIRECRGAVGHPPAGRPSTAACRRWFRRAFDRRRRPTALGMRGPERPIGGLRNNSYWRDAIGLWPPPRAIMAGMRRLRGWGWHRRGRGAMRRRTK